MIKIYRVTEFGRGLWCTATNNDTAELIVEALQKTYPNYTFKTEE